MERVTDKNNNAGQNAKRRSGIAIMASLIGLVKPLLPIIILAVLFGTAGYFCAIFLTIITGNVLAGGEAFPHLMALLLFMAVMRGILHYVEQYCNHFIAFKLLAIIRHDVFAALRRLCPAKLEGRDKGNLISIITSDIELLEVFYAHTISPIAIAILTEGIMVCFIGSFHPFAGLFALAAYLVIGVLIPLWNGKKSGGTGMEFRNDFGDFNSFLLDSFRGLDETLQYGQGEKRKKEMSDRSVGLGQKQKKLSKMEGTQRAVTNMAILVFSFGMLFLTLHLYHAGEMDFTAMVTCTAAMMGSFGPVVALSSLSNNLNQTLASGERVLSILEEKPLVEEIPEENQEKELAGKAAAAAGSESGRPAKTADSTFAHFTGARAENVTFSYQKTAPGQAPTAGIEAKPGKESAKADLACGVITKPGRENAGAGSADSAAAKQILRDFNFTAKPGKITGIHGPSGCGKSTLLKLFMRFWDTDEGSILVSGKDVREIPTHRLRQTESYVTQETHIFHDTIAANIAIGKPGASMDEIMEAAKKASVHDFIMGLPDGYDTEVGELGDTLSGGEKQRIGIARAFLHDAPFLLLDEPTSNLDSLNEGIILKSLKEEGKNRTVLLVSHRESTMNVADEVLEFTPETVS